MTVPTLNVRRADYLLASDRTALCALLDGYACDPMGGEHALDTATLARLCDDLAEKPWAFSFIAWEGERAVGLVNCFEGYSTFKARPLVNIHDLAVLPDARGRGVGQALLQAVETEAQRRQACKITLEVLTGNAVALKSYTHFGFVGYQLVPGAGHAIFLQKWITASRY